MRVSDAPRIPQLVGDDDSVTRELGERFERDGFETWIVGGPVRDFFLGRQAPDIDVASDD